MAPPVARKVGVLKFLDKPVDFGKKIKQTFVFGSNKTWRGVVAGIISGVLIIYLQLWLYKFSSIQEIAIFNYHEINILYFGLLISSSAILGDLSFAFIKRRLGLKPGAKFLPFDQTNYVISSAILLTLLSGIDIDIMVWIVLLFSTFLLHIIVNRIGYSLNINKAKW